MDKNTRKILKFYNAHFNEFYSPSTVYKLFPYIKPSDILEILKFLHANGYLRVVRDSFYQSTNKGKEYFNVTFSEWISNHIVSVLAFIISIFSLIVSIISLLLNKVQ